MTSWASRRYKESLGARLKAYGLRYDDLFDPVQDEVRSCSSWYIICTSVAYVQATAANGLF